MSDRNAGVPFGVYYYYEICLAIMFAFLFVTFLCICSITDPTWFEKVQVNLPAVKRRAEQLSARRTVKKQWQGCIIYCVRPQVYPGEHTLLLLCVFFQCTFIGAVTPQVVCWSQLVHRTGKLSRKLIQYYELVWTLYGAIIKGG